METAKAAVSKTENVILDELSKTASIAKDIVLSGGWAYPLRGIIYFITHPSLYRAVAPVLLKCILASIAITLGLFVFTYLPQVAFCAVFSGPLAFVAAATLVFSEAYALILLVSKIFFLGRAQDNIFDAVMLQQGHEHLVSKGRVVTKSSSGIKKIGASVVKPLNRLSKDGLIRYLISLPLNAIPGIGTAIFLVYNGTRAGPGFHARYFQLKGLDKRGREVFVEKRKGAYTSFGITALLLNLVPVAGLAFGFTSTVGAALWASDLEKAKRGGAENTDGKEVEVEVL